MTVAGSILVVAMALAAVMGVAIQRGATCTVAAMDEILSQGKATRLSALLEASQWVAVGLIGASQLHLTPWMPGGLPLAWNVLAGGAILGFGAWINRACVFGAIARFGSGEVAYVLTPLGFYLGCLAYRAVVPAAAPVLRSPSPVLGAAWLGLPMLVWLVWRLLQGVQRLGAAEGSLLQRVARGLWTPAAATGLIAITFVLLLVLVGDSWAYTDVLAELASGRSAPAGWRMLLLFCLFAGAVVGGIVARRYSFTRPDLGGILRCLGGGALMGVGSLMIPGSNDGLILLGMPLLFGHAWLGFAAMCLSIGLAMRLSRA